MVSLVRDGSEETAERVAVPAGSGETPATTAVAHTTEPEATPAAGVLPPAPPPAAKPGKRAAKPQTETPAPTPARSDARETHVPNVRRRG